MFKMDNKDNINEEDALKALPDDFILDLVNEYLPENQRINKDKGLKLIPQAKKIFLALKHLNPIQEEFDLAIDFFNEGKKDLKRSRKSYLGKDYSDSIYHLQQAAEKIMKSYGLAQGVFSKKDLRDISHQTPKAFIKMVQEQKIQLFLQALKQIHPNLNTEIGPLKKVIETKDKELALLPIEKINLWLDLSEKIEDSLDKINIDKTLKNILPDIIEAQGKKRNYPSFSIMKLSTVFIKMYLIAAMTYPHEAYTRYPDREIKPSQYTENLGIVKAAPQIFEILEDALEYLGKFIDWKNENKIQRN